MVLPMPGTPEHAAFMKKAMVPGSLEGQIMKQMRKKEQTSQRQAVAKQLNEMIELVPGQLFRDVSRFHQKFELAPTTDENHALPDDVVALRLNFMLEELEEYAHSVGFCLETGGYPAKFEPDSYTREHDYDVEKAFDGLIDLTYVALGTAYLHGFPFNDGWYRVQEANMAKVRSSGDDDPLSTRKSKFDVVKPPGWKPPVLKDLIGPYAEVHAMDNSLPKEAEILLVLQNMDEVRATISENFSERVNVATLETLPDKSFAIIAAQVQLDDESYSRLRSRVLSGGSLLVSRKFAHALDASGRGSLGAETTGVSS